MADRFHERGRLRAEEKLPRLLTDIQAIADSQSQTDPSFKSEKLYTRLAAKEIRKQLIREKGYTGEELPTIQTINTKVNQLGYTLKKVRKVKPFKKIEQTDEIFSKLRETHVQMKEQRNVVRLSIDTKDRVKIGDFSRGGSSRVGVTAILGQAGTVGTLFRRKDEQYRNWSTLTDGPSTGCALARTLDRSLPPVVQGGTGAVG